MTGKKDYIRQGDIHMVKLVIILEQKHKLHMMKQNYMLYFLSCDKKMKFFQFNNVIFPLSLHVSAVVLGEKNPNLNPNANPFRGVFC